MLFCALLLRLGDLLDFDDTRAPRVLFNYAVNNEKSIKEIKKHRFSAGFSYPETPSLKELPYKAKCTEPGIEHAVRDFLDWIDEELMNCCKLQKRCNSRWQDFPLPRAISREGIESCGYMSGDFCITMDQNQILNLMTGENLYDSQDVFVRELLQNAIDATLLRSKMDSSFKSENSRIDFWEWIDREGNTWFRIDDRGTGMTLGMLQRYFLKVGNSYYNSKELKRDLQDHGSGNEFYGISQFGIGFLSCFLCADYAEVSTLYFYEEKNRREDEIPDSYAVEGFGLRMQITGLSGYYMLKNQAKGNHVDNSLPAPDGTDMESQFGIERDGYRSKAGTSIVLRLDPGKLGSIDLQKSLEKYLYYPRVPVYYNNKKVGYMHDELINATNKMIGKHIYEFPKKYKEEFDKCFPAVAGQYPKIIVEIVSLDANEYKILPSLSGLLLKMEIKFDKLPQWKVKDIWIELEGEIGIIDNKMIICLETIEKSQVGLPFIWNELTRHNCYDKMKDIAEELDKYKHCPKVIEEIKNQDDIDVDELWRSYNIWKNYKKLEIPIDTHKYLNTIKIEPNRIAYSYQGVKFGSIYDLGFRKKYFFVMFLLEDDLKPNVKINRSNINESPLKISIILHSLVIKNNLNEGWGDLSVSKCRKVHLSKWREIMDSYLGEWLEKNHKKFFIEIKHIYEEPLETERARTIYINKYHYECGPLYTYLLAYLQDNFIITINYEKHQFVSFVKKKKREPFIFDIFPPMLFLRAENKESNKYICVADYKYRKGITIAHPYVVWLLDNAVKLKTYYPRQFAQIIDCLLEKDADDIIQECNQIREQLIKVGAYRGIDAANIPKLSEEDFWYEE